MPEQPTLSVVVPTLNEASNIAHLVRRLTRALRHVDHEIIVVDDASADGTADLAESLRPRFPALRVVRRTSDFGLSKAILAGFAVARGELLAVIDADLQHDPGILPSLLTCAASHPIVVASRYAFRDHACHWSLFREVESRLAAWMTRRVLSIPTRDPLSGYFLVHRDLYQQIRPKLRGDGWKLLLEILVHSAGVTVAEVPFTFRSRERGKTKMNWRVVAAWLRSLLQLRSEARSGGVTPMLPRPIARVAS